MLSTIRRTLALAVLLAVLFSCAADGTCTATVVDGGNKANRNVCILGKLYIKKLTKTGSNGTVTVPVGSMLQLVPTFATRKGWKIKSASSSKSRYAFVNNSGLVKAREAGTATVTFRCKNGKKATVKVKVVEPYVGDPPPTKTNRKPPSCLLKSF